MATDGATTSTPAPISTSEWWKVHGEPRPRDPALPQLDVEEVASWYQPGDRALRPGVDFLIVDVRRSDCETMIPGAINLPAHSLPHSLPSLLPLLSSVPRLVFHCNSSKGRGPRAAGWTADALDDYRAANPGAEVKAQVYVLKGGIVAWKERFGEASLDQRGAKVDGLQTRHL
ncbi:uncharacterized protein PFL1_00124 [Pseudozyma flocculosa PF-1]|uniref:Rhodanese domain-containing protein n=1 Tax=Pseudozyma flocculosa TaxID=84751 RepID=A0A5C3ET00_9BASI|nr:uncharacterized protein PFL1_00124 [Pseudozyma flocculosa PF-1]EPQ31925.1 hypothetical protein PFL1_00124 [Pseudozyma flocculosa PF-1]SPO35162.1 uncharacterized protein PSFLO_00633 [Pseudozyma flocculosa]